jgi:hypothetical protein
MRSSEAAAQRLFSDVAASRPASPLRESTDDNREGSGYPLDAVKQDTSSLSSEEPNGNPWVTVSYHRRSKSLDSTSLGRRNTVVRPNVNVHYENITADQAATFEKAEKSLNKEQKENLRKISQPTELNKVRNREGLRNPLKAK